MALELFSGWQGYEIALPFSHRLLCFAFRADGRSVDYFNGNHNIFRVDQTGREVWQITRDDSSVIDWAGLEELYQSGVRREWLGFAAMTVVSKDGVRRSDVHGGNLFSDVWTPGCTVYAAMMGSHLYTIDPDAGIAHIIPGRRGREW